jgi:hypothetical protein
LVGKGFVENYTISDHHGERCTKASNQEGITQEVREPHKTHEDFYNNANLVMMHDGKGHDGAQGSAMVKTTKKMASRRKYCTRRSRISIEGCK